MKEPPLRLINDAVSASEVMQCQMRKDDDCVPYNE